MSSIAEHRPRYAGGGISVDSRRRWVPALAGVFTALLLLALGEIVVDGAAGLSPLTVRSPQIAGWFSNIGELLGYRTFLIALLVFMGAYAGILLLARRLSVRFLIALTVALQAIVFIGPVLLSTDVFSYIAYARMGALHGINPYTHGPISIFNDPVYRYVGEDWRATATAYGPLYTLLSYPLAPLGVAGALWGMKLEALLASAGTLVLTWRCARIRGLDPKVALVAIGVNPLWVIYGLGGAHNDLVMIFVTMVAVSLALAGREVSAGASIIAGTLLKATAVALLPFVALSHRRIAPILGAAVAVVVGALVSYLVFGIHGVDVVSALSRDSSFVSTDSFPTEIAHLLGKPGVFPIDHDLLKAGLVLIVAHLLWRTWRGYDWVAASGWALLAIAVTSAWLLPWYTLWPLPLAVVSRDRRLLVATLAVQGLFVIHQITPLLVPVS